MWKSSLKLKWIMGYPAQIKKAQLELHHLLRVTNAVFSFQPPQTFSLYFVAFFLSLSHHRWLCSWFRQQSLFCIVFVSDPLRFSLSSHLFSPFFFLSHQAILHVLCFSPLFQSFLGFYSDQNLTRKCLRSQLDHPFRRRRPPLLPKPFSTSLFRLFRFYYFLPSVSGPSLGDGRFSIRSSLFFTLL